MRALLLICLIGTAAAVTIPANAEIVRCEGADGKAVYREVRDCPSARRPAAAWIPTSPAAPSPVATQRTAPTASITAKTKKMDYVGCKAAGKTYEYCMQFASPETQKRAEKIRADAERTNNMLREWDQKNFGGKNYTRPLR